MDRGSGMVLTKQQVARMIDISAVKAESNRDDVKAVVGAALEHQFIGVFALPSLTPFAKELLGSNATILLGGVVGFPSGGSTTRCKVNEARELLEMGCQELDMVVNIGKLRSGLYPEVGDDIQKVVDVSGTTPVKAILEVALLNQEQIQTGAKIIQDSGAAFVKTGTGWNGATSFDHIRMIKEVVGDSIPVKVAGGVRTLDTLVQMYNMGVSRFGAGHKSALEIIDEFTRVDDQ